MESRTFLSHLQKGREPTPNSRILFHPYRHLSTKTSRNIPKTVTLLWWRVLSSWPQVRLWLCQVQGSLPISSSTHWRLGSISQKYSILTSTWRTLMSVPIRYPPMPFYFRLSIILLTPQILWHLPHRRDHFSPSREPLHDHHQLYPTHHTIGPVPCQRPFIWPMDHIVTFSFLSLFSFTWHILLQSDQSQIITPHNWDLTIRFAAHRPCAHFTYRLYFKTFVSTPKKKEVFPQNSDLSSSCLIISLRSIFAPSHLCSISYFQHLSPYRNLVNLHLTPFCTPQYYVRRPFHCSRIAPLRAT